jgi:hypothetical protein
VSRAWPWVVGALGAVLVVAGVGLFALANSADVGWTSYVPLDPAASATGPLVFADGTVWWTRQHALGAGLAVLGLLVLAGLGGWFLGRRSARRG